MSYENESLPNLSIIIITLNCADNLKECLSRIAVQNYPKEKIETLVIDGGSTDGTPEVAKSFGAKTMVKNELDKGEPRRGLGLYYASHEIVVYIDSDIFLPNPSWLREMVVPFLEDETIVATQPLFYEYRKEDHMLNRYFSLLGNHDPLAYYLKKTDRFSYGQKKWNLFGQAEDKGRYFKVKFDPRQLPPLGCNGFLVKKRALLESALPDRNDLENFNHSDAVYLLIAKGYDIFGFVKTKVIHNTSPSSISGWMKKRIGSTELLYFRKTPRKYKVYDPKSLQDNLNLIKYILYSLTIIKPTYDAFRGFLKLRDPAWFMHPIMCLAMLFTYGYVAVKQLLKKIFNVK